MTDLLQLLITLDERGCLRIDSDGNNIYVYFKHNVIPDDLRDGIIRYKNELLQKLKRPCQWKDTIQAKGVLII